MRKQFRSGLTLTVSLIVLSSTGWADDQGQYEACQETARRVSGYNGPVPAEQKKGGGAVKGAIAGAAAGATIGWITDSDKSDAAKKGAALGLLIGAVKKAQVDKKRRANEQRRQRYLAELDSCMTRQS